MHKINLLQKYIHEKKNAQKMLVNSAFFRITQYQQFFHRELPERLPLILTEALAECP